jgi:hypothetical protein
MIGCVVDILGHGVHRDQLWVVDGASNGGQFVDVLQVLVNRSLVMTASSTIAFTLIDLSDVKDLTSSRIEGNAHFQGVGVFFQIVVHVVDAVGLWRQDDERLSIVGWLVVAWTVTWY